MDTLPQNENKAFEAGVLKRSEGYGKQFNPYRNDKDVLLYNAWLKGWINQNIIMNND